MKKILTVALVLAIVGAGFWFAMTPKIAAPLVSFNTLDDRQIPLESLRGKVVLVKFWATSCVTCVRQMPDTTELYETLGPKGLEVVAVAMSYDPIEFVKQFTATRKLPFVVAPDKSGEVAKAFDDVKLTPIAFLIDRDGNIVKRYLGMYDKQDLRSAIEKALAG
jgi:peroxiredoxin